MHNLFLIANWLLYEGNVKCWWRQKLWTFMRLYSVLNMCAGCLFGGGEKGQKINRRTRSENPQSSRLMYKLHLRVNVFSIFISSLDTNERVQKKHWNEFFGASFIVYLFLWFGFLIDAADSKTTSLFRRIMSEREQSIGRHVQSYKSAPTRERLAFEWQRERSNRRKKWNMM